jgi:exodeoxyribonuclease VII large subunit
MARKQSKVFSVYQINTLIKSVLADGLPGRFTISAEISGFKPHSSGHCYFSLKDDKSIMPCVMWRSSYNKMKFQPENGMAILATGHVDVYEPGGKYQFYVDRMEPAGVGDLQLAFEQMVKRLHSEGLFEDDHKKKLPPYPMHIGIVSSEAGAAVHDIADSIYNRWPCAKMSLYPVPVQGAGAAKKIATAIKDINRRNKKLCIDVLIVGRGGGSLEDLWEFNEELVARAIFASKIPVISAVGHEVDTTIADLVADARASTPTKAGVIAVPDMAEVCERIANIHQRLFATAQGKVEYCGQSLQTVLASAVFRNPLLIVGNASQQVDELNRDMLASARERVAGLGARLDRAEQKVRQIEPHRILGDKRLRLSELENRTNTAIIEIISKNRLKLTAVENRLGPLDPKSVLTRGYSITTNARTGKVVTGVEDVRIGDEVVTELAEKKTITSKVTK